MKVRITLSSAFCPYSDDDTPGSASGATSPYSVTSRFEVRQPQEKAEHVLSVLVHILSHQHLYAKFIAALPMTRIILLLLGDRPSPPIAFQILRLVNICLKYTSSFSRKFELISGWSVMKTIVPSAWSSEVNERAFDILLGRFEGTENAEERTAVVCPGIMPTILASLQYCLGIVSGKAGLTQAEAGEQNFSKARTICL